MFYSIQFLRGIAALMVVMTHVAHKGEQYGTGSLDWFHIGGDGVELFFVISGFIMCSTTHNKNTSFLKFIKNRIERIIPLYWILSFVALMVFIISPGLVNSSGGTTGVIESFFLVPNGDKFLIQNGWTLSYEFYYYIIFSLFILLTSNRFIRYTGVVITIVTLSIIGVLFKPESPYLSFLSSNLLLGFVFGVFSFIFYTYLRPGKYIALGLIVAGVSYLVFKNELGAPEVIFGRAITSGLPMFIIFLGMISLEGWFSKNKGGIAYLFEQLGNSSYSLYLVHPFVLSPVAMVLNRLGYLNSFVFSFGIIAISITAGLVTFYLLERPIAKALKKKGDVTIPGAVG